jgi:hypothetical protein
VFWRKPHDVKTLEAAKQVETDCNAAGSLGDHLAHGRILELVTVPGVLVRIGERIAVQVDQIARFQIGDAYGGDLLRGGDHAAMSTR